MVLILHSGACIPLQKKMRLLKERSRFDPSLCLLLETILKKQYSSAHTHLCFLFGRISVALYFKFTQANKHIDLHTNVFNVEYNGKTKGAPNF